MFQAEWKSLAFPFSTLMGPISVKAPNCELAPGPPWSQMRRGMPADDSLGPILCPMAEKRL